MKLSVRPLYALVALVLVFAVGMASLLNYFKFESTVKKLQRSRIALVATDVHGAMEKSLALGMELTRNDTLGELLERQRRADPLILAIDVFDDAGHVMLSTQAQRAGAAEPEPWTAAAWHPGAHEWFVAEPDAFVTGINLHNSFDVLVGSVAVRYGRAAFDKEVAAMGWYLAEVGLAVVAVISLLAAPLLLGLLAMVRHEFGVAERALAGDPALDAPLAREMTAFRSRVAAAGQGIEALQGQLNRIGPAGR